MHFKLLIVIIVLTYMSSFVATPKDIEISSKLIDSLSSRIQNCLHQNRPNKSCTNLMQHALNPTLMGPQSLYYLYGAIRFANAGVNKLSSEQSEKSACDCDGDDCTNAAGGSAVAAGSLQLCATPFTPWRAFSYNKFFDDN